MLDVGSADGPSVSWVDDSVRRVSARPGPAWPAPGWPACVLTSCGCLSATARSTRWAPSTSSSTASRSRTALAEAARVLRPGGRLLLAVPAYAWAWSSHDVHNDHHRRYTRPRLVRALTEAGLDVVRSSYAFASVFPLFAAHRLASNTRDRSRTATRGPGAGRGDGAAAPRRGRAGAAHSQRGRPQAAGPDRPPVRVVGPRRCRQAVLSPVGLRPWPWSLRCRSCRSPTCACRRRRGR